MRSIRRRPLAALTCVLVGAVAIAAGCGGSGSSASAGTTAHDHGSSTTFEGGTITPRRPAPPLVLRDYAGKKVDIASFKGAPVLVTFVYSHCPDVCPLIMTQLRRVARDARKQGTTVHMLAVSVDPRGDTPAAVRDFLERERVKGTVDYLIGTRAQLEPVWAAWQVARDVPKTDPEQVEHSALVYGVTASGELATAYPVNFDAAAIARDLPLLAHT
jgi:protein SCO1/2